MKILLDECITKRVEGLLTEFDVYTVSEMGFSGMKNGNLLAIAESSGFDILLTIDKNIDHQQNIKKFDLTIVIFDVFRSGINYIEELVPDFKL
jgi:hypothetical protein